jgi:hypothetical protein
MARREVLLATGLVAMALFGTGFSGSQWTSHGPINAPPGSGAGQIARYSVQPDPTATGSTHTVYAAASTNDPNGTGGVFKSLDGGASWNRTYTNPLRCLTVDPGDPNRLFGCRVVPTRVHLSTDGGSTFTPVDSSLPDRDYTSVAIKGSTTGATAVIYATTSSCGATNDGCKVYRSSNGGGSWAEVSGVEQLPSAGAVLVRIDPVATPDAVYVVISNELWRSTDAGASWSQLTVPGNVGGVEVYRAASASFATVYALTSDGVFVSNDSGATFSDFQTASLPADAQDFGSRLILLPGCASNAYLAVNTANASGGVYRSLSGGAWQAFSTGLTETNVRDITVAPGSSSAAHRLYAGTLDGHVWGREVGCIVP